MNFILPHSFELDLPGIPLLSTLELLLFGHSNRCIRVTVLIMGDHLGRIYLNCQGIYSDRLYCFRIFDAQDRLFDLFCYTGKHPVCGEPLFCFSANPDSLSELCGFHINHRSRSFLLKVSGVSSHLSFCCTSLVSGFIIQEDAQFVYSQSAQQIRHTFASKVQISGIHEFRPSSALLHLPGKGSAPQIVPGHRRHCSGMLNRYHHRARSYINLICPL